MNYALARWKLDADNVWVSPYGDDTVSALDLRTLPEQGRITGTPGWGFFAINVPVRAGDVDLGTDIQGVLTSGQKSALKSALPFASASRAKLSDVLLEMLTSDSDPDGQIGPRTMLPDRDNNLCVCLPGHGVVALQKLNTQSADWIKIRRVYQETYREIRTEAIAKGQDAHRGQLDIWSKQLGVSYKELIPSDLPDEGTRPHGTQFSDNFSGGLASWTADTGSWTSPSSDISITNSTGRIRYNTLPDGNDQHSMARKTSHSLSTNMPNGPAVRVSSSADTMYAADFQTNSLEQRLHKYVSGVQTELASRSGSTADGLIQRCEAEGSTIRGVYNGNVISATDTAITSGSLGFRGHATGGASRQCTWDDWEGGDVENTGTTVKTIGTASRDYASATLWEADLDNRSVYTFGKTAQGEGYNDSVLSEQITFNGGETVGLDKVVLTAAAGEEHDGTPGTGARWKDPVVSTHMFSVLRDNMTISKIEGIGPTVANKALFLAGDALTYNGIVFDRLLAHDAGGTINECILLQSLGSTTPTVVKNCFCWDAGTGPSGICIQDSATNMHCRIFNNTTLRGSIGISVVTNGTAKNNICVNASVSDIDTAGSPVRDYNCSSDATATGANSLSNQDPTTDINLVSIVDGSEDLHIGDGSVVAEQGDDLTANGVTGDIDGDARPLGLLFDMGADERVVKTIVKSIGSAGRDYATPILWEADLDDLSVYTGGDTAQGEMYNDSVFGTGPVIDGGGTIGLVKRILTVPAGERHDGTAGTGVRLDASSSTNGIRPNIANTALEWLEIFDAITRGIIVPDVLGSVGGLTVDFCILHDNGSQGVLIQEQDGTDPAKVRNCISYANGGQQFQWNGGTIRADVQNCSAHGGTECYNRLGATGKNQNCIGAGASTDDFAGSISTENNNCSEDATAAGAGSLTNQSATTDIKYVSVVGGSENLHINGGSVCQEAGTDLSADGVTEDIDNESRPLGLVYEIGADETAAEPATGGSLAGMMGMMGDSGSGGKK